MEPDVTIDARDFFIIIEGISIVIAFIWLLCLQNMKTNKYFSESDSRQILKQGDDIIRLDKDVFNNNQFIQDINNEIKKIRGYLLSDESEIKDEDS